MAGELSETERSRIVLEERYRADVRKEIGEAKSSRSRLDHILDALNQPIALWFLTSVVLGAASWIYAQHQLHQEQASKLIETVFRLSSDLQIRLERVNADHRFKAFQSGKSWSETIAPIDESIFPEFKDRTPIGMALELVVICDNRVPSGIDGPDDDVLENLKDKEPGRGAQEIDDLRKALEKVRTDIRNYADDCIGAIAG